MESDKRSQELPMSDERQLAIEDGNALAIISPTAERALTRKFDLRILPVLAIMCVSLQQSRQVELGKREDS